MREVPSLEILIVEGSRGDHSSFGEELNHKGYQVTRAASGSAGLELLPTANPHVVVVDAASLRTSGVRICQSFRKADRNLPILLIVDNGISMPEDVDANLILKLPFTIQKLVNRLHAYHLTTKKHIISAGPIKLNTQTHLVLSYGRQTKLTPRMVEILKILIENNGKIVERDPLFKKIWDTDYTGDTRTLDVHISWLRQAIEENPNTPKLIRTIRGVGYQLNA